MALEFIGTDDTSHEGQSPTVLIDPERQELVIQSWTATPDLVAEVEALHYPVPGHETVIRVPIRMARYLRNALDELEARGGPELEEGR